MPIVWIRSGKQRTSGAQEGDCFWRLALLMEGLLYTLLQASCLYATIASFEGLLKYTYSNDHIHLLVLFRLHEANKKSRCREILLNLMLIIRGYFQPLDFVI